MLKAESKEPQRDKKKEWVLFMRKMRINMVL